MSERPAEAAPRSTPDARAEDAAERAGWEEIAEWMDGMAPADVEALRNVRDLEAVYPLLHALVGRGLRDFLVRAAALECLVADERPSFGKHDLDRVLYWLGDPIRESTLRILRQSGWLEFDPGTGTTITDAGRWAYDVLSFLHRQLRESELLPTLAGVEYAMQIGVDPIRHLLSMRSRLVALRQEIDDARASHSEVVLKRAAAKHAEALQLAGRIRAVLDGVPVENASARRVVREIHDLLSRLLGAGAELHAAITEVGRQYLQLTAGLTIEQIVSALMRKSRDELASVAREALLPVLRPPPMLTTEVVASAAEQHMLRERHEPEPVVWEEPPEAPRATDAVTTPEEVLALLADLRRLIDEGRPVPLSEVVPRASASESFLRASLLPLAGDDLAGEGVAGQLGALRVHVALSGDGWPQPLISSVVASLSPGDVSPRSRSENRDG